MSGSERPARTAMAAAADPQLARRFDALWATLAGIGRDPAGGYRRFAYDDAELTLRDWFVAEATARGLACEEDRAGNLWAWWGEPGTAPAVATGSHLDAVRQGGAFDGPLGVVAALLAVDELRARGHTPVRPVAVVAFADEEGARFGVACAGSRLLTGQLAADRALALRDEDGVTLADALRRTGRNPAGVAAEPARIRHLGVLVELHIEQGRGLVDLWAPVALATAIRAHGRWRFDLTGRPDHAGTTRLEDRDDALVTHARVVLEARAAAARCGALATVGRVQVDPNGVNAIAGRVRTWLDARAETEAEVRALVAEVAATAGTPAVEESFTPRVVLDTPLRAQLTAVLSPRLGTVPQLATGAGHDAGTLALAGVPTAMLFVRNPTGVSHAPDEHAERDDCVTGVLALADCLAALSGQPAAEASLP